MSDVQLVKQNSAPVSVRSSVDIEGLFRAAIERGPEGVAVMERLMAVRRELNAEQAKAAFDAAMAAFQDECPVVDKGKKVIVDGKVAYGYAPFETILATIRPTLKKHGFSFTLDTDTDSKDGWVIAKCKVTHAAGHSETSTAKFPLASGTRLMSTTQVYAAALTFASRRVFCNAFGIVTSGEDNDGQIKQKPEGPSTKRDERGQTLDPKREALKRLWAILAPIRGADKTWATTETWLRRHRIITTDQHVADLDASALAIAIEKTEIVIQDGQ